MPNNIGLIILDGWGIGNKSESDAIYHANTPYMDMLLSRYPNSTLSTSGEDVGLPDGQMGNSEVGHLNIGAGRIVYQELTRINKAVKDGDFFRNPVLQKAFETAKETNSSIHFMGLVSKGGVHSSQNHLYALCQMSEHYGIDNAFVHAFTDGRDCDPKSGQGFLRDLEAHIDNTPAKLVSVIGRYYAMDRDTRWERVKKAYDLLVKGTGQGTTDFIEAIQDSYKNEVTDEFIEPLVKLNANGEAIGRICDNDIVVCFNFRTDRCREITVALTQQDFPDYEMETLPFHYVTMTNYDKTYKNVQVLFEKDN